MKGRVLGRSTNKNETWVADSGTSVSIMPVNIAKRNGIKWRALNQDEPNYSGVTGTKVTILGQTNTWIKFKTIKTSPPNARVAAMTSMQTNNFETLLKTFETLSKHF